MSAAVSSSAVDRSPVTATTFPGSLRHPDHADQIQRVLAIPAKRHQRGIVSYLADEEIDALLNAPTDPAGMAAATTLCSYSPSKPVCAQAN